MVFTGRRDAEFRAFFSAESERLRRFAIFLTGDAERATDLTQEALARTYRSWGRIKSDPGAYARRILVNLVRGQHRRRVLELRHENLMRRDVVTISSPDDRLAVIDALKELSPIRRAVIILRFWDDMTEQEIARVLDRPLGTVKSDIHRSLGKLRGLLEESNGAEA